MINESDANTILPPLPIEPTRIRFSGGRREANKCARTVVGTAVTSRASCGRVERQARPAGLRSVGLYACSARGAVRDVKAAGTAAPVPKYISSGVCPRNAECGSTVLYSWT
jgi:hypothetical protein